jgi:ribosomal protein S18 acetylase RimI-like enzyme
MRPSDAGPVARVHRSALVGFLPTLGDGVLTRVYAGACTAPRTVGLVVEAGGGVVGFALAACDTRQLFRHVLVRRGLGLGLAVLVALLRRPGILRHVLETPRYPSRSAARSDGPSREAELVAIGVLPAYRGQGCATAMMRRAVRELARLGMRSCGVATYASNEEAAQLYRRLGFELVDEFTMYGRTWMRYRIAFGP